MRVATLTIGYKTASAILSTKAYRPFTHKFYKRIVKKVRGEATNISSFKLLCFVKEPPDVTRHGVALTHIYIRSYRPFTHRGGIHYRSFTHKTTALSHTEREEGTTLLNPLSPKTGASDRFFEVKPKDFTALSHTNLLPPHTQNYRPLTHRAPALSHIESVITTDLSHTKLGAKRPQVKENSTYKDDLKPDLKKIITSFDDDLFVRLEKKGSAYA